MPTCATAKYNKLLTVSRRQRNKLYVDSYFRIARSNYQKCSFVLLDLDRKSLNLKGLYLLQRQAHNPDKKGYMRKTFLALSLFAAAIFIGVQPAQAQAPTGNISGRVTSSDGQPLPGVTVSITSDSAPGTRSVVTTENGDYVFALLPPGVYTISFTLDGFQGQRRTQNVAGTQNAALDVTMPLAGVTVAVNVVAQAEPFAATAQVATNFKQDLMAALPTNRTIDAVLLMAPAVHPTGPRGAYTINGSQSYENLWILNGTVINENLRGLPMTPYIEDAIQEVTVASSGVSAEYGRFAGGVATAVTKSGGNQFSGSFRTSFANDSWRSLTPFQTNQLLTTQLKKSDLKADNVVPTYEATMGGPVIGNRLWFFGAARSQKQEERRTTVGTNISYLRTNDEQRYEGKLTYTPAVGHLVQGSYFKLNQTLFNNTGSQVADLRSLTPQGQPQTMISTQYTGVLTPNFSLSVNYSARKFSLTNVGADTTDRILGTLVLDLSRGWRYWSPTFCSGSACGDGDEQRNNENAVIKGSYFLSNNTSGTHHIVFGYDYFNDNIIANTHPSGSDYRIRGTSSIVRGTDIYPVFLPGTTTLDKNPLLAISQGSDLRTHSLFANDTWRFNDRLTFNLGLRLDKNDATDGDGANVGNDASFSPRLSAIWDPTGNGRWAVNGSFARYTMALTSNLAASTARAGNAATYRWVYTGAPINADLNAPTASLVTTESAIRQVFAWHDLAGGDGRTTQAASLPGVNMKITDPLTSPYAIEYSTGVSRALGQRGTIRADFVYRDFNNFYSLRTDLATGKVVNGGVNFDLGVIENSDRTDRQYVGLTTQLNYEVGSWFSVGGNYTLSRAHGDLEGETVAGGPSGSLANNYPEYRVASWNYPSGDLAIDQRHRSRMWATYHVPVSGSAGTLAVGLLQQFASGVPFAPVVGVPIGTAIENPGYATPPAALEYFVLGRNPFRTEATYRTDLSVNYGYRFSALRDFRPELFFHGEVLNVFNQFQACGCGENVFRNGGISDLQSIGTGARLLTPFNPYTTTPVEGVHWAKLPGFGEPQNTFGYTSPRIFRFSVGVKF